MGRIGFSLSSSHEPLHAQQRYIEELPDLGYDDLWFGEMWGIDTFTPLVLSSVWAPHVRLGIAVAQVFARTPAMLAMSVAGLCQAAPGRVVVGLGSSSKLIVENWQGVPFEKPYSRVRDTLDFLRRALAGERVKEEYDTFRVDGFKLAVEVEEQPKILLGGLRQRMLELSGAQADGAILGMPSAEDVTQLAPYVRRGGPDKEIVALIQICPLADVEEARKVGRITLAPYLNAPVYMAAHKWMGRGELLAEMWQKWSEGDRRGAAAAIPDEVVDALIIHGSPEQCREHIQRYFDSGVDTMLIDIVGPVDAMQAARDIAPKHL